MKTPNAYWILTSVIIVIVFYFLASRKVDEYRKEYKELEQEKQRLEALIVQRDSAILIYRKEVDSLQRHWSSSKDVVKPIIERYEVEKHNVANLPIDSTVLNLADWLSSLNANR